jgi:hypothetical protein
VNTAEKAGSTGFPLKEMTLRNRLTNRGSTVRRLASILALAALAVGLQPVAAGAAVATGPAEKVAAAGWTKVGTFDPTHVNSANTSLVLYGVYAFAPGFVNFDPRFIPASVRQIVVPNLVVPDDDVHTYKLVFHLATDVTTPTRYQLLDRTPVTVPGGDTNVEFVDTVQFHNGRASWKGWTLANVNNDHWLWYSCDIYEQTS